MCVKCGRGSCCGELAGLVEEEAITPTADVRELVEAGDKLCHYLALWSGSDGRGDSPLNPYKRVAHEAQRDWRNLTTKHSEAA